mmetsp:Transcript_68864/g.125891  ORF Transcript_68864/g.125891 Transcript_68864/m.125891 type:complete len:234 (+) Transcript_68864:1-702(+)
MKLAAFLVLAVCMLQSFANVSAKSEFGRAFEKAHREQGSGGRFSYGGREYSTNRADGRDLRAEASRSSSRSSSTSGSSRSVGGGGQRTSYGGQAAESRGVRNNNPGNIRVSSVPWQGKVTGSDSSFETFNSAENGIRALAKNTLTHFSRGKDTVQKLISTHAPDSENPTSSFVNRVSNELNVSPNQKVNMRDANTLKAYVQAVIKQENKNYQYPEKVLNDAINSALGTKKDEM